MKTKIIMILTVCLLVSTLVACSMLPNRISGTYTIDSSGLLGKLASSAVNSLSFSGDKVTVDMGAGVTWTGTYTLEDTVLSISPKDGGTGLSGTVSKDKKTITIAKIKFVKE